MTLAFSIESWIWYGVVTSMVILRYIARISHFKSVRKLQLEDWFMLFVFSMYTVLIEFLNICVDVSTNLINPADIPHLTPQDVTNRVYGSKCVLVVESCMCTVQWGTKACLLLLYWRLTQNLTQGRVVKFVAAYVGLTFVIMMSLYYGYWCRPFYEFWKTPTDNIQCATQTHHLTLNLVFNLSSDLLIMSIPLPLLLRAHLELKKKILLIFPFSLGFFTMICAILSKNLSFNHPFSAEWVYWYCREASTAMIVSNMPYSWAIVRRVFHLKSFFGQSDSDESDLAGQVPQLDGVSIPPMSRVNTRASLPSDRMKRLSIFKKNEKSKRKISNATEVGVQPPNDQDAMREQSVRDWTLMNALPKKQSQAEADSSNASSLGSSSKTPSTPETKRQTANDVDKLYCLDDDDLEKQAIRKQSRGYEPDAG